jgi:DNA gyrase/topoisomerase IV subunit A
MCLYDDQCPDSFKLAFDSKYSNQRKSWIATWKQAFDIEDVKECPITKFINEEFIQYSVSNLHRSIPRMMDGLKVSQRKVLWAAFTHWKGQGLGQLMKGPKEIKVERFASITAEATNYHHGGNCLSETIISMAQNFVGANNMPYFTQDGQFGCVAPETPILLFSRQIKLAKDIVMEDVLIGDDGRQRHISKIVSGQDEMYRIKQKTGDAYIVNSLHILTLWDTQELKVVDISLPNLLKSNRLHTYRSVHFNDFDCDRDLIYFGKEIEIEHVGRGPYCGWYLDSNERFLLGDFTVTHNTRNMGGEDSSAPRYPDTRPQEWLKYVYLPQDFPLMERVVDEGNEVEPVSFLPIIPMALVNGCLGIGTGHSTFIPNCSPMEITDWLLAKLESKSSMPVVLPWYRGFNGNIKIKTATVKEDDFFDRSDSEDESEGEDNPETPKEPKTREITLSMVTTGKVHVDKKTNIHIQELPIGIWIHRYKEYLETLLESKRIADFSNLSTHETPKFIIQGFQGKPTFDKLKLRRTYGLTNMVLLDMNNIPRKYKSIDGLMEEFFRMRLPYYSLRKQKMLEDIISRIKVLEDKYKFLKLVIEDKIIIFKKSKQEILQQMKSFQLPEELLTSVRLSSLSEDELVELSGEIKDLKEEMNDMQKLLPEDMWILDLKEFKKKYIEMFGKDIKEEIEGDELEDTDDETIPYTKPKKEKKQEMSEHVAKKISKVGQRLKKNGTLAVQSPNSTDNSPSQPVEVQEGKQEKD